MGSLSTMSWLGSLLLFLVVLPEHAIAGNLGRLASPTSNISQGSSLALGSLLMPHSMKEALEHSVRGACGYHDVVQEGYGLETVALSNTLFNNGQSCGACYDIKCVDEPQWCKPGQPILHVRATNNCPSGGWCSPPREHFDIAKPVFLNIAEYKAGIIPVIYRRVPCQKKGGIRFTITGNPYFNEVLVWNVGGAGEVISLQVKGDDNVPWTMMKRMWGQRWVTDAKLVGESLTFRVEASDTRHSTSWHVAPKNWQFGQTFEGKNFR